MTSTPGHPRPAVDAGLNALMQELHANGRHLTQTEIAARCGCTQATIHQIEKRALRKIRRYFGRMLREISA